MMTESDLQRRMRLLKIALSDRLHWQPVYADVTSNREPDSGLDANIPSIIPILKRMDNLVSGSLWLKARSTVFLERNTIADIVDALPASCTALEIDTLGLDEHEVEGRTHLCDSLRRVMPQMYHVKIHVASVCPALLGTGGHGRAGRDSTKPCG